MLFRSLDGNLFFVEVTYNKATNSITFVKGHNFEFNGVYATPNVNDRWGSENALFVGSSSNKPSSSTTFGYNPFNYVADEENGVRSGFVSVILDYKSNTNSPVKAYEVAYGSGSVFHVGIYGDQVIETNPNFQQFLNKLMLDALT